jgi:hypothetical protein
MPSATFFINTPPALFPQAGDILSPLYYNMGFLLFIPIEKSFPDRHAAIPEGRA